MKLQHAKLALAAVWAGAAVMVMVGTAQVASNADRIALAIFGVMPPMLLWFSWNEPAPTMSESIHAVRDEGRSPRHRVPRV